MKKEVLETQNQWLTPELFKKITGNEKLRNAMKDPIFLQAIEMMKTDPKKAMEIYGKYPELIPNLMEFNKIMGGHMESLSNHYT